jgi:ComF family protein
LARWPRNFCAIRAQAGDDSAMTNLTAAIKSWANAGLGFLYPEVCRLCGEERATTAEGYVGSKCRAAVRFLEPPWCERCGLPFQGAITGPFECGNCKDLKLDFDSARSAVTAGEKVLEVIHHYKYNHALWFEPFLADLLIARAGPDLARDRWDVIVPVPLYAAKLREREFNQAERLAARLSRATNIPMDVRLVRRVLPTCTQTLLTREQRLANVRKAFAPRPGLDLTGRNIVLVDDVLTTGATTSACARVLRQAGADKVCVWTVARGT